jgi:hypothetical protein
VEVEEKDLRMYRFISNQWVDLSNELSNLEKNYFVMELTKLIAV